MNTPIFEENDLEHFKGIDIMRAVRSFDPCLPCGVHMYLGKGKTLKKLHSPTQVADPTAGLLTGRRPGGIACHRRTFGPSGTGSSSCSTSCTPRADPGASRSPRSCCVLVTDLYGGGLERIIALASRSVARARAAPASTTSSSPACCSCTASIPTTSRRVSSGRSSRCGRSSRHHDGDVELLDIDVRRGRRAPSPARRPRRLPVVDRDAAAPRSSRRSSRPRPRS